jgi:hypothetical protein
MKGDQRNGRNGMPGKARDSGPVEARLIQGISNAIIKPAMSRNPGFQLAVFCVFPLPAFAFNELESQFK